MMNYGDGVYAGMAVAAMYGEAFFESDPRKLVEHSLTVIPPESKYSEMIRDVLRLRDEEPDWQKAWHVLEEKWGRDQDGEPVMKLDVRINGAYVYMGLLYGDGDFWKSMNIAMRCGLDSDCNPSTVGGILGTALGMKAIPEKWAILRDLPIENESITISRARADTWKAAWCSFRSRRPSSRLWSRLIDGRCGSKRTRSSGAVTEVVVLEIFHRQSVDGQ
jgi:hypothetical protein